MIYEHRHLLTSHSKNNIFKIFTTLELYLLESFIVHRMFNEEM